ncbi:hypothetical protein DFJ58DRAFT_720369 [Suillus subalutaceus]|uniref:uncharacterized protein n=1 Tax=Suillus subalutaceus TaxID=48586 RepID=UPI001B884379|nr:uncharacterized protein DFJ58DRAFT_720369 [Suillus subalutaceus]KAG1877577.1 hypothetical protein DFJ58DRAFT_720369 [Suillus subalutaceus]
MAEKMLARHAVTKVPKLKAPMKLWQLQIRHPIEAGEATEGLTVGDGAGATDLTCPVGTAARVSILKLNAQSLRRHREDDAVFTVDSDVVFKLGLASQKPFFI